MPVRSHPLYSAKPGDSYFLQLDDGRTGYVQVLRGSSLGLIPVVSRGVLTDSRLLGAMQARWFFEFLAPRNDSTVMGKIGHMEFESEDDGWPPPRFESPDEFQSFYRIIERGVYRRASERDVVGLERRLTVEPAGLKVFLRTHLDECRSVDA